MCRGGKHLCWEAEGGPPAAPGFSRPDLPLTQYNNIDTNLLENS